MVHSVASALSTAMARTDETRYHGQAMVTTGSGFSRNVLHVNLSDKSARRESRSEIFWRRFVGGGLAATAVLYERTKPGIVPLGAENVLVFTSSVVGETTDALDQRFGAGIHVATIGPAGERCVRFASIVTDRTYQASRMGMGAVMGSKNLKAIVLCPGEPRLPADSRTLAEITDDYARRIPQNGLTKWQHDPPGFSCWIYLHGIDAALCVNNYSDSTFDGLESLKEENFLSHTVRELGCPGCPNNCIKAIYPATSDSFDPRACGIHQEITGTMGPNIGVGDLDVILAANSLCNQYGLDPTSLGFTISFAMELFGNALLTPGDNEGRSLHFGDADGALEMIEKIAYRQGLGSILAEGTRIAAGKIGHDSMRYAMQVKGLEMVCFEPRSQTNLALGYAVAPVGPRYDICEHDWDFDTEVGWEHSLELARTLGILERVPMAHIGPDKVRNLKALMSIWSAADALDLCIFAIAPTRLLTLEQMARLVNAATGWETSSYELMRIGERRLHFMRLYNMREGLTAGDDCLPDRFFDERISTGPRTGDVLNREAFQHAITTYYRMMGWTDEGKPNQETLIDAGLEAFL